MQYSLSTRPLGFAHVHCAPTDARIKWPEFITRCSHRNSPPMKTILVLIGGGDRDQVILRTALAAALPLSAHLDFLHVHVSAGIAARHHDHVQFALGAGIRDALDVLETKAKTFSEVAADHVREFCAAFKIEICDAPTSSKNVTASFRDESDTTTERLIFHARESDLVVMGSSQANPGIISGHS